LSSRVLPAGPGKVKPKDIAEVPPPAYVRRVQGLKISDAHQLNAACGWLELGNLAEVRAELAGMSPESRTHPAVLRLQFALAAAEQNWDAAFAFAEQLLCALPGEPAGWLHCAYALRRKRGGGLEQARDFLAPAAQKFPREATIAFNLACYECQLRDLPAARRWLQRACEIGGQQQIHAQALADADLQPLWAEIQPPAADA